MTISNERSEGRAVAGPDGYLPSHFYKRFAQLGERKILWLIDSIKTVNDQLKRSRLPELLEDPVQDLSYAKFFHQSIVPLSKSEQPSDMDLIAGLRIATLEYRHAPQAWNSELERAYLSFPPKLT